MRRQTHSTSVSTHSKRFFGPKVDSTGIDPRASFIEFTRKDVYRNIDIHRDNTRRIEDLNSRQNCPAIGCTKTRRPMTEEKPPVSYTIETDHISMREYEKPSRAQERLSQMKNRQGFEKNEQTKEGWMANRAESTLNNCQSTHYDIINFSNNPHAVVRKTTNIDARRHKGITEYSDLMALHNSNYKPEYKQAIEQDNKTFFKRTGIFTHMYDASARLGNIIVPFEKQQDQGKPAFKI